MVKNAPYVVIDDTIDRKCDLFMSALAEPRFFFGIFSAIMIREHYKWFVFCSTESPMAQTPIVPMM